MQKFVTAMRKVQEAIGTFLLAVFFIAILVQIAARYMKIPLLWTEELANYSFIWAVFMGASVMVYYRAHFSFTFFRDRFKGSNGALYSAGISLLLLAFTLPMTYYGLIVTRTFWNYNWISLPWMKMGYTWMCLPIMGITMSIYNIVNAMEDFKKAFSKEVGK